jgi:hypothetical protein
MHVAIAAAITGSWVNTAMLGKPPRIINYNEVGAWRIERIAVISAHHDQRAEKDGQQPRRVRTNPSDGADA